MLEIVAVTRIVAMTVMASDLDIHHGHLTKDKGNG